MNKLQWFVFCTLFALANIAKASVVTSDDNVWLAVAAKSPISIETQYAIALAESGKTVDGAYLPHRFAIAVGADKRIGQENHAGFYPKSREAAIELLSQLLSEGHTNIGIGLMQINIMANPDIVSDITSLFDPKVNIQAAHKILSWCARHKEITAILSCYNTGKPKSKNGLIYAAKVLSYRDKYSKALFYKPPVGRLSYDQLLTFLNKSHRTTTRPTIRPVTINYQEK